ncbi:diguanylate cyclase [Pseudomonas sp. LS44]|uniref:sensor domain-containing diguanylate cyclase n=1 Tax=Pseudomonas sp. LS44 TaxID=1357074 RepID=UPI00215A6D3F|nr:diguanylate cyclase [Pseudomonas sp. LS44]UVE17927.1 diguanylate cyclase [Pseudomonas sp. LS44]
MRLLFVMFWLYLLPSLSAASPVVQLPTAGSMPLESQVQYLLDAPDQSFEQIAAGESPGTWQDSTRTPLNLGVQRSDVWLRFDVRQPADMQRLWHLVIKWPLLDYVELRLYYPQTGRWSPAQLAGDGVPAATRAIASRYLVFPLPLAAGEQATAYLRVRSFEPVILPLELMDEAQLQQSEMHATLLIGLFFGAMLVMLLYNACLSLFTRERSYLLYVLYIAAALFYALVVTGLGQLYFDWASPWLGVRLFGVSSGCVLILAGLYLRNFLHLGRIGGWVDWTNRFFIGYWCVFTVLIFIAPSSKLLHWMCPKEVAPLSALIALISCIHLWRKGYRSARLFIYAWGLLMVLSTIMLLALAGHLPSNDFTLNSQVLGMTVEFILLAIALVEHINQERSERLRAQQAALDYSGRLAREREEKLHAQQQALRIQRKANEELEQRVDERTRELAGLNVQLERLSSLDPLTHLFNRRHFETRMGEELCRAKRAGSTLAVLMVDIDHFKSINDRFGHPFGDECLRRVAAVLHAHSQRAGDVAARYGGEEFILLFADTGPVGARHCAELIRADIAALRLAHKGGEVRISASIGLVVQVPDLAVSSQTLIAQADVALYRAKAQGRDRVICANELVQT